MHGEDRRSGFYIELCIRVGSEHELADVTALISLVLGGNASAADHPAADMNGDGNLTVADVTALISYVLSGAN